MQELGTRRALRPRSKSVFSQQAQEIGAIDAEQACSLRAVTAGALKGVDKLTLLPSRASEAFTLGEGEALGHRWKRRLRLKRRRIRAREKADLLSFEEHSRHRLIR